VEKVVGLVESTEQEGVELEIRGSQVRVPFWWASKMRSRC